MKHTTRHFTPKARILIADDHSIYREGLRSLLKCHDDFEIVGEVDDGAQSIEKVIELHPDIVLMAEVLPGLDGLQATRRIKQAVPTARVMLLVHQEGTEQFLSAIRAGAAACLPRRAPGHELIAAIRAVRNGGCYLTPAASSALIESCRVKVKSEPFDLLTERQREILGLVVQGYTSRKIGDTIKISLRTVENHRFKVMKRLRLRNQAELIEYAYRKGLVTTSS